MNLETYKPFLNETRQCAIQEQEGWIGIGSSSGCTIQLYSVVCHSENRKVLETETAVMYTLEKLLKASVGK